MPLPAVSEAEWEDDFKGVLTMTLGAAGVGRNSSSCWQSRSISWLEREKKNWRRGLEAGAEEYCGGGALEESGAGGGRGGGGGLGEARRPLSRVAERDPEVEDGGRRKRTDFSTLSHSGASASSCLRLVAPPLSRSSLRQ